jgi:uncharacterized protein (UPF0303 family)
MTSEMEKVAAQEQQLIFELFDEATAWQLGNILRSKAEAAGQSVAIDIRLGKDCLFFTAMKGTTPVNADWARRKRNLVNRLQRSSYALGLARANGEDVPADDADHAAHGGCFPIRVAGVGFVGTATVSGLPQRDDHILVVQGIADLLKLELGEDSF